MAVEYISIDTMREVCHRLAVDLFDKRDEPIATFEAGNRALIESSLAAPRAGFGEHEEYRTIHAKAAVLFYSLIKNHAFPNGNKRIALTTMVVFLYKNGRALYSGQELAVRYARKIAQSDRVDRERVIRNTAQWIRSHMAEKLR